VTSSLVLRTACAAVVVGALVVACTSPTSSGAAGSASHDSRDDVVGDEPLRFYPSGQPVLFLLGGPATGAQRGARKAPVDLEAAWRRSYTARRWRGGCGSFNSNPQKLWRGWNAKRDTPIPAKVETKRQRRGSWLGRLRDVVWTGECVGPETRGPLMAALASQRDCFARYQVRDARRGGTLRVELTIDERGQSGWPVIDMNTTAAHLVGYINFERCIESTLADVPFRRHGLDRCTLEWTVEPLPFASRR
jgi:hypothetical protein